MSSDSSKPSKPDTSGSSPRSNSRGKQKAAEQFPLVGWSALQSAGLGILIFFVPQIVLGLLLVVLALISGDESISAFINRFEDWQLNTFGAAFVASFGSCLIYLFVRSRGGIRALGLRKTSLDDMITVLPIFFGYFFSVIVVFAVVAALLPEVDLDQAQEVGFDQVTGLAKIAAFFTLVIVAPVYEEILFRGFAFQGVAKQMGFWPAAILTSGMFAIAHGQLNVGIDTFILGMFASWLVWHTKSLLPAIALHMIKNFVAYLFLFVFEI